MKKILSITILFVILLNILISSTGAVSSSLKSSSRTNVSASVGEFTLSVSGEISPNASIVMTDSEGTFLRAGVADKRGNFSISQVLIKKGFSGFCLTAIDFKRLGESTTCFSFAPAQGSINMPDLFLPPTMGLLKNEITAGSDAFAYGYTMPFAAVTMYLNDGTRFTVSADATGYYKFTIKNLKAGSYQLFANAKYQGKQSLDPTKRLRLRALSLWEQILAFIKDLLRRIYQLFTSTGLGPLWLLIPLLILIIILILKLWPERFTFIYQSKLIKFLSKRFGKRRLHHWWWLGY